MGLRSVGAGAGGRSSGGTGFGGRKRPKVIGDRRVIFGKDSAVAKRSEIYEKYSAKGDTDFLRRTYGVPFNDLWILQREY